LIEARRLSYVGQVGNLRPGPEGTPQSACPAVCKCRPGRRIPSRPTNSAALSLPNSIRFLGVDAYPEDVGPASGFEVFMSDWPDARIGVCAEFIFTKPVGNAQ
jgi:hypothetical protein